MNRISLLLIQFLLFNAFAPFSVASDPVTGPPTWIVDAQIVTDASHGQQEFTGTILNWSESQQTFAQPLTKQIGSNKVRMVKQLALAPFLCLHQSELPQRWTHSSSRDSMAPSSN